MDRNAMNPVAAGPRRRLALVCAGFAALALAGCNASIDGLDGVAEFSPADVRRLLRSYAYFKTASGE